MATYQNQALIDFDHCVDPDTEATKRCENCTDEQRHECEQRLNA